MISNGSTVFRILLERHYEWNCFKNESPHVTKTHELLQLSRPADSHASDRGYPLQDYSLLKPQRAG